MSGPEGDVLGGPRRSKMMVEARLIWPSGEGSDWSISPLSVVPLPVDEDVRIRLVKCEKKETPIVLPVPPESSSNKTCQIEP
jgi:hypothetical protein